MLLFAASSFCGQRRGVGRLESGVVPTRAGSRRDDGALVLYIKRQTEESGQNVLYYKYSIISTSDIMLMEL